MKTGFKFYVFIVVLVCLIGACTSGSSSSSSSSGSSHTCTYCGKSCSSYEWTMYRGHKKCCEEFEDLYHAAHDND